ncbi:hypothetical protein M231_02714 [Tremella mesenterica]|uniref:Uncharacterized protein n=1 Tax=Tremella mesenterica TaxID=5217 RepID=A0A4Q1BQ77_TREME|nr:hypothetical protein M231_02714 [Tremella mesenterica]
MSSEAGFVDTQANISQSNVNATREDQVAEDSEITGTISKDEVEGLKDSLGGGQTLDDSEGYTRSSNQNNDAMQQEREIDAAVDELE